MPAEPARDRRVVVTRPADQAAPLAATLRQAGYEPILLPLLELEPLPRPADLVVGRRPDRVIAVSPSAIDMGRQWWPQTWPWPPDCPVYGVGAGTRRRWSERGHRAPRGPEDGGNDSSALLALPELNDIVDSRILILRGEGGRDLLGPTLRQRGAHVEEWPCYRRGVPQGLAERLAELLQSPPDAWVMTSSEAVDHLHAAWPDRTKRDAPVFATHPRIAATASAAGWPVIICDDPDAGLLAALQAWFDAASQNAS